MIFKLFLCLWVSRNCILININLFKILRNTFINIHEPIGSLPWVTTFWLFENVLFRNFSHPNIIKFAPFLLEAIIYKRIVVATHSISIMNTNWMQMIWMLLQLWIAIENLELVFKAFDFFFHLFYLNTQLIFILGENLNAILDLFIIFGLNLIDHYVVTFNLLCWILLFCSLPFEESSS